MKLIGGLTMFVILIFLSAFTVQHLWLWFIVPLGASAIGMAHAYGLALIVSYFKMNLVLKKTNNSKSTFGEVCASGLFGTLAVLMIGYIVTLFM